MMADRSTLNKVKDAIIPVLATLLVTGFGSYVFLSSMVYSRPTMGAMIDAIDKNDLETRAWVLEMERLQAIIIDQAIEELKTLHDNQQKLAEGITGYREFRAEMNTKMDIVLKQLDKLK